MFSAGNSMNGVEEPIRSEPEAEGLADNEDDLHIKVMPPRRCLFDA